MVRKNWKLFFLSSRYPDDVSHWWLTMINEDRWYIGQVKWMKNSYPKWAINKSLSSLVTLRSKNNNLKWNFQQERKHNCSLQRVRLNWSNRGLFSMLKISFSFHVAAAAVVAIVLRCGDRKTSGCGDRFGFSIVSNHFEWHKQSSARRYSFPEHRSHQSQNDERKN